MFGAMSRLSPRQHRAWGLMKQGKSNKEIAHELDRAIGTVSTHLRRAADKILGPGSRLPRRAHITPRQLEVLERIAALWATREIAADLTITVETVRVHKRDAIRGLGCTDRNAAVRRMRRLQREGALPTTMRSPWERRAA